MFRVFVCFVLLFFLTSFATEKQKNVVAVTLQPYAKILQEVGGDRVEVVALIPPNANPHTFEPKPKTLKEFSRASLYFSDGSGMDNAWMPRFLGVNKQVKVESISKGIVWMEAGDEHHHDNGNSKKGEAKDHVDREWALGDHGVSSSHREEELDPHTWTSPKQALLLGKNMVDALVRLDFAGKSYYEARLQAFQTKMLALDKEMTAAVQKLPAEYRTFIVFHPSFGYLARDYGLTQMAVEVEGKEPKPQDLNQLVKVAKAHHIHVIFVQPQFSKRSAESLANELNAVVVSTDPLAYDFDTNLKAFAAALLKAAAK